MARPKKVEKKVELTPEISILLVGHVDHGKTTLTQALSGKWTDTHSEELKRGITIKLGYADSVFYKCPKCETYGVLNICKDCKSECIPLRKVSFIDAPGHETLMATMLSGAAIVDAALLLVSANEPCPQPQTREHLMALEILGIKDIIVVQNKIDLVEKEKLIENYNSIKSFLKGSIAENAPIIPISAQHNVNIDVLIETIQEYFKTPHRNQSADPLFYVARSFDINKPGSSVKDINGGVIGGAMKEGMLKIGEIVEIRPGIKREKFGKTIWEPITTEIANLMTGDLEVKEITPGGSAGILTKLDSSIVKSDSLAGNVVGVPGHMPEIIYELNFKPKLLERVVGAKDELLVDQIKKGENLMLNANSTATVGMVVETSKGIVKIILKKPICVLKRDRITISRMIGARWRLIGWGSLE
ncbi:translation initiation factor IF-2 subunit gamma [Candidatus Woesearchaeota archaeon]|nr:translation initiation factor IF-2 subunit gamma [Candidatus Woesearchaeota archaeon]